MTEPLNAEVGTTTRVALSDFIVDSNIRKNNKVPAGFQKSVKQHGVLTAVDGYYLDGHWHLQDGQLRYLASLDAGHFDIPVLVGDPALSDADRVARQIILNEQRTKLTDADLTGAHQTLFDLGVSADQIARRTNAPKKLVDQTLAIAGSTIATEHLQAGTVTLEHAATIAEFDDDAEASARLVWLAINEPNRFPHHAAQLQAERQRAAERAALVTKLTEAGVTIITEPAYADRYSIIEIDQLFTDAALTNPLSTDSTKVDGAEGRRGLRAYVYEDHDGDSDTAWYPVYCIEGWSEDGLYAGPENYESTELPKETPAKEKPTTSTDPTPEEVIATAQRRAVIANNKAWPLAKDVRRTWIIEQLLVTPKLPTTVQLMIAYKQTSLVPHESYGSGVHHALEWLDAPKGKYSQRDAGKYLALAAGNAERLNLAIALASVEDTFGAKDSWRRDPEKIARYLDLLQRWGYGLSDLEQTIVDAHNTTETTESE